MVGVGVHGYIRKGRRQRSPRPGKSLAPPPPRLLLAPRTLPSLPLHRFTGNVSVHPGFEHPSANPFHHPFGRIPG